MSVQILAFSPFRTGSIIWEETPGQTTLTVVCKATYVLTPGVSPLAPEPEEVNERDNHWDDDPRRSLYLPSDLAPLKPSPEVILVGSAFAPRAQPVRSLLARLAVGDVRSDGPSADDARVIDKTIEVFCPRTMSHEGELIDGPLWTQMPLRYERAAGGEGTWNPVGLSSHVADRFGRRALPNLQQAGVRVSDPNDVIMPVGFGPIAPTWPGRRDALRDRAATFRVDQWSKEPLGEDFDAAFFQTAPPDQHLAHLRADEQIVLENLHAEHPKLVTKLPGVKPRARVEPPDTPAWDLVLVADTLWIDTQLGICTLVWRGQVPLDDRDQEVVVRIGVEEPGKAVRWPSAESPPPPVVAKAPSNNAAPQDFANTTVDDEAVRAAMAPTKPVLPFQKASPTKPPAVPVAAPPKPIIAPSENLPELWTADAPTQTMKNMTSQARGATPTWLDLGATQQAAKPPPAAARPAPFAPAVMPLMPTAAPTHAAPKPPQRSATAPPAPLPRPVEPPTFAPVSMGEPARAPVAPPAPITLTPTSTMSRPIEPPPLASPTSTMSRPIEPPSLASSARIPPPPPSSFTGAAPIDHAGAAYVGVLEASNAAADARREPAPQAPRRASMPSEPPPAHAPRTLIELVFHDASKALRVREIEAFRAFVKGAPPPAPAADADAEAKERAAIAKARAERADVTAVITRATPVHDVEGALMDAASEDGDIEPPLVVVAGELEIGLDEVKMLEAMLGAAASFAASDKKLKEVIDLASEVMRTPLGASPGVAAGFITRIRDAWTKTNRLLPADYLDVHTRRLLLEQRAYQKRELWGEPYVRAMLVQGGEGSGAPAYLPLPFAKQLPLFARFPARVLAEAFPQQDQLETSPVALRVAALARVVTGRAKHR